MLVRFRRRMHVEWVSLERIGGAGTAAIALAALVLAGTLTSPARAAGSSLRYLERAQNPDGGFGGARGQPSSQLLTGWAVIGLEAAGRNPLDVRRRGRSPIAYIHGHLGQLKDTGDLERTILALEGAGVDARHVRGRDLVAELLRHRRADGSFERQSNWTAFGVLALRATGRKPRSRVVRRSAGWLAAQQNSDGGFSFATRGGGSFVDETGAAVQGLAAAGRRHSAVVKGALGYLRSAQNADGGFGQSEGYRSNAQSTSWAVQGIVAAGKDPARFGAKARSPLAFLASLRAANGSYRYSRSSVQTPVWVTAQAIAAIRRKALPLRPVPRRVHRAAAAKPKAKKAHSPVRKARRTRASEAAPAAVPRPAPAAKPVSESRSGGGESDGTSPLPAIGAGAAVLVTLVTARFLSRRRHV